MTTMFVRDFFVAMLSRFMSERGLAFNTRIEGHGDAFVVGESRELPQCVMVFDGLLSFATFAFNPRLMVFAKLYIDGHVSGEGDWFALANVVNRLNDKGIRILEHFARLVPSQGIDVHYGWSAEAFARFLDDPYMQYTCGRGGDGVSLEESQLSKLGLIARWLEVRPMQRHLDVGSGWGGLILYFTERHQTLSHGLTLSPEQASYARQQALSDLATFSIADFKKHVPPELYDIATVVGMLEHVPIARHTEFFEWLAARLRSGGRVYLQCITRSPTRPPGDRTRFLKQFVFAHELNTVDNLQKLAERAGFTVVRTEEGHTDYAFTTRQWVERLRANEREIKRFLGDDKVFRILLGYLTMGSLSFSQGHMNLHRLLLVRR